MVNNFRRRTLVYGTNDVSRITCEKPSLGLLVDGGEGGGCASVRCLFVWKGI